MMNLQKPRLWVAVTAVVVFSSGCVNRDTSDLDAYISEVLARPGGKIDPLPPLKPYERYLYQAAEAGGRNPFQSFFTQAEREERIAAVEDPKQNAFTTEIQTHNAEELENFELDSLRMVGVLEKNNDLWGIITDTGGIVHRVRVGNYIGRNYGKILNIEEDRIDVREIVKDSEGRWEERQAVLALVDD